MYAPNSTQSAQQFGVDPFQRVEIPLFNIDRSQAAPFPQYEGDYIYVERCDYPVLLKLVVPGTNFYQTHVLRDGMTIAAPFKGFFLAHPVINQPMNLSLMIGKGPRTLITNQLDMPCTRAPLSTRVITNTAVSQIWGIFLPPGMRSIARLNLGIGATTVTQATLSFLDKLGAVVTPATGMVNPDNQQTYSTAISMGFNAVATVQGGIGIIDWGRVPIPTWCAEIQMIIAGTGLTAPNQLGGWFE